MKVYDQAAWDELVNQRMQDELDGDYWPYQAFGWRRKPITSKTGDVLDVPLDVRKKIEDDWWVACGPCSGVPVVTYDYCQQWLSDHSADAADKEIAELEARLEKLRAVKRCTG